MFLLKIFGGLWRKRRVGIEQSACCYPGEKEMTHAIQTESESPDLGEVHNQYQSAMGQDQWGEMATPTSSLWGYRSPSSGFSASFLIEYTGKNTSRQYRHQRTEVIIVILALHHEPNPVPSKSAKHLLEI